MKCFKCPANIRGDCLLKVPKSEQFEYTDGENGCSLRTKSVIGELNLKGYEVKWTVKMK